MVRVFVTGATGMVGQPLLDQLVQDGHEVTALSRREHGPGDVSWVRGDIVKGRGLGEAWRADCVIHAASKAVGRMDEINVRATYAVLAAMRPESHLIYPSIVGCDQHPLGYYRSKWRGEQEVMEGGRPWTILRGTQTHELLWSWLEGALPVLPLGKGFLWQPIAAADYAARIARAVRDGPGGRIDVGGPQLLTSDDIIETYQEATGRRAPMLRVPSVGKVARAFRDGVHCVPTRAEGRITWGQFLAAMTVPAP